MLQNAQVITATVSKLLKENELRGVGDGEFIPPTQIRVKIIFDKCIFGL